MKKMKATIKKSIGNTYLIEVEGSYFDIVLQKTAMSKVNKTNILIEFNNLLKEPIDIEVNDRVFNKKKVSEHKKEIINWTDKRRSIGEIINFWGIEKRIIKICPYKFIDSLRKTGFHELENPKIGYYVVVNGFELRINKYLFNYLDGEVLIIEERAA